MGPQSGYGGGSATAAWRQFASRGTLRRRWARDRYAERGARVRTRGESLRRPVTMLSILLSTESDISRQPQRQRRAHRAVRQRFTDFLSDFRMPWGRLESVCTGNRVASSNLAPSAYAARTYRVRQRFALNQFGGVGTVAGTRCTTKRLSAWLARCAAHFRRAGGTP